MKYIFIILLFMMCAPDPFDIYLGRVADFDIIKGSALSMDTIIITLHDGNKVMIPHRYSIRTGQCVYANRYGAYIVTNCPIKERQ